VISPYCQSNILVNDTTITVQIWSWQTRMLFDMNLHDNIYIIIENTIDEIKMKR
jgi:hypothetical protein